MRFSVSDLLFPGFQKYPLRDLSSEYGIEFFYEFGKDYYWNEETASWGARTLSIHGPCVAVNLADKKQTNYSKVFEKTFAYAQKVRAEFVVVHTNESWQGDKEKVQALVIKRLRQLVSLAKSYGVRLVIENVGLRTKGNVLFDLHEYIALFDIFPDAYALIDTGHAHVNGWELPSVIEALQGKLIGCHVHDNNGDADAHLPVGEGNIDWKGYFSAIKKFAPKAVQVFEYSQGFATAAALEEHITALRRQYRLEQKKTEA